MNRLHNGQTKRAATINKATRANLVIMALVTDAEMIDHNRVAELDLKEKNGQHGVANPVHRSASRDSIAGSATESSRSRRTASLSGFFDLSHVLDRPLR